MNSDLSLLAGDVIVSRCFSLVFLLCVATSLQDRRVGWLVGGEVERLLSHYKDTTDVKLEFSSP